MQQRISRKKFNIYAFDIESHNDEESIAKQETSMWLGCLIDENSKMDDESCYFYNMDSFIDRLIELSNPKRKHGENKKPCKNICIYIYNLSFEWSFILPVLLKRGIKFKERIEKEDEYVFNSTSTKSCSSVYLVQLKFSKSSGLIIFKDLAKIYGGGLGNVAKSFDLPTQKGEIDYRLNRLHNYQITKEEKEYCFKDTRIIIDILLKIIEKGDRDFWNIVSMASYSMKKLIMKGYPRATRPYKAYREDYPELDEKESEFLRHAVSGGITYAPSKYQFKDIKQKIIHIDAHQMHPTQAYQHFFPYGKGEYFKGYYSRPYSRICCYHCKISYDDVKLHSVISLIGFDFIQEREVWLWDFEIPTMKKCYVNLEIEYIDGYAYKMKKLPWRDYYKDNYNLRLISKAKKDAFGTLYYKLLNNSSYGKHLEKPHNQVFENYINELGVIDSLVEDKPLNEQQVNAKYTYLGFACIPAYSRVDLIETALLFGWENICYFDTDSIFVLYSDQAWKVWEEKIDHTDFLGGWGLEEIIDRAQFTAPKRYKTEVEGHTTIKAGGINFNAYIKEKANEKHINPEEYEVEYDEINIISSSWKVQRAYRVKGGTIIEFQDKSMDIQKKYIEIYNRNMDNI